MADNSKPPLVDVYGPMVDDRVFILISMIHLLAEVGTFEASIDHRMGGPTSATLLFGDKRYKITIEDM